MRKRSKKNSGLPRKVRFVSRSMGEIAGEKIAELAHDLGDELQYKHGWRAYAARRMGIDPAIVTALLRGKYGATNTVGLVTIQRVARKIGLSAAELLGEDE